MALAHSPKQARARATKEAVVAAAVDVLAELGLAGTSTAAIARRAGVSQGALFRHFPTKTDLLAATTAHILDALTTDFVAALPAAMGTGDLLKAGLEVLWSVYVDPRLAGVFELFLAARTDPELAALLRPIVAQQAAAELALARLLFAKASQSPDFDATVAGLMSTIQGVAVAAAVLPRPTADTAPATPIELRFIDTLVRRELGTPQWPEAP